MKVLVAPDKFKGTLTATEVADAVAHGISGVFDLIDIVRLPVADGGDGTLAAALAAGFGHCPVTVHGPTGQPVASGYAVHEGTAVIELADACGLDRLPAGLPDALRASTVGFGEVIRAALDNGCRRLVLGVGGSASTDGGAGMLTALGARLTDRLGRDVPPEGGNLDRIHHLDLSRLHPALMSVDVTLASDVDNPLLGDHGAAAVYGPQKGASPDDVARLDAGLLHWSRIVAGSLGVPAGPSGHPAASASGAGAAGGVGFAAVAVLGADLRPGIELMLEITGFYDHLPGTGLVITGEGSLDEQTLRGKAPAGVADAARRAGIPVVAVCGRNLLTDRQLRDAGIRAAYALLDIEPDVSRCLTDPEPILSRLGRVIARDELGSPTGGQSAGATSTRR